MSEIKWAYDESNGSFSALPASPFLLPALGLLCLAPLIERAVEKIQEDPRPLPKSFDRALYNKYKQRYQELSYKRIHLGGLNDKEIIELNAIMRPPWASHGELWSY